jgi:hypothetical protein
MRLNPQLASTSKPWHGPPSYRATLAAVLLTACLSWARATSAADSGGAFERDVYPILRRSCLECHDSKNHKGGLRLDSPENAFKNADTIVKGNAAGSELYKRVTLPKGHDDVMPNRGEPLSTAETDRIKNWIDAGAHWPESFNAAKHWAYVKPNRSSPLLEGRDKRIPVEKAAAIDALIQTRLKAEGLDFAPEADRNALLRRLSLDLVGLPPSPQQIEAFAADARPDAYERLVDRLLASDQFGVRWARQWMDCARYADSHGFQRDDLRDIWPYRDWVVKALNEDMPFTQFTIEQLAGDLLPGATEAQRIATGFNRNAPTNVEAGTDPEETRVNQVLDRVNTVGMVWLGSTLECAQCHDHKYDPITQRDYYGLFAFFNNTSLEADRSNPKVPGSIQFKGPTLALTDPEAEARREKLQTGIAELKRRLKNLEHADEAALERWESNILSDAKATAVEHGLKIRAFDSSGGATHEFLSDDSVLLSGEPVPDKDTYTFEIQTELRDITGIKLEALADDSLPGKGPGRGDAQRANFVLNSFTVTAAPADAPDKGVPLKFASAAASFSQANLPVQNLLAAGSNPKSGWAIAPQFHQSHWAKFVLSEKTGFASGTILRFRMEQNFGASRTIGRFRISAVTGHASGATGGNGAVPAEILRTLEIPRASRSADQTKALTAYRLKHTPDAIAIESEKLELEKQLQSLKRPSTLVMIEDSPRMSSVFERGEFRNPKAPVEPAFPAVLVEEGKDGRRGSPPKTRLDLAAWLVSRENPLTARVTVNRWWAELFGHGLVATPEDFGIKGELPTHPELLDWLACEFMDNGWSMKSVIKTIVMSRTYRQSSKLPPFLAEKDDQNQWYARGPRHRMEAELIRDNALSIAGLLNTRLGGEPIRPYQPDGLWIKVGGQKYEYTVSPGDEKYRRGLYVVIKRGAPYPSFTNFDANARMACRVKRTRSNTPLQALTLMNDPVYVEAAMAFARRVLLERPDAGDGVKIEHAFLLATARKPRPVEFATLQNLLETERELRRISAEDARNAADFASNFKLPAGVSAQEFSAWYALAAAVLNMDETISKQ